MLADNRLKKLIVEIVGTAGAGKTTVLSNLSQNHDKIRPIYGFRRMRYVPFYVSNTFLLLPVFLYQSKTGKWYSWQEMNRMIRLKAVRQILKRQAVKDGLILILDQGPIYTLTMLAGFGSKSTKNQYFENWWERTLKEWAMTLDMIIWLDAPNEVLLDRIHTRDKQHLIKDKSDQEAKDFLVHCQSLYRQTLGKLTVDGGPKVLCYDTSQCSLAQVIEDTLTIFNSNTVNRK